MDQIWIDVQSAKFDPRTPLNVGNIKTKTKLTLFMRINRKIKTKLTLFMRILIYTNLKLRLMFNLELQLE